MRGMRADVDDERGRVIEPVRERVGGEGGEDADDGGGGGERRHVGRCKDGETGEASRVYKTVCYCVCKMTTEISSRGVLLCTVCGGKEIHAAKSQILASFSVLSHITSSV